MDKKQEFLSKLKRLCEELGRRPTHQEINNCSYTPTKGYYVWHYGCVENALKIIGCEKLRSKLDIKKDELKNQFFELKEELGFVPSSVDWINKSKSDISSIYRIFGSWPGFLKEIGEQSQRKEAYAFKNKKRIFIADDGHICYSKKEKDIDNILYELGIEHENEVYYPYDKTYNKNSRKRCDWKIGNTYLEYAGMLAYYDIIARKKYRKRIDEKANLCLSRGLDFLYIEPNNLKDIKNELKQCFNL